MTQSRSDLASYVSDARPGLTFLARLFDDSIRAVTRERDEKVAGRPNPQLFHGMVRERVAMAAAGAPELIEAGVTLRVREADSMQVCIEGSQLRPKVLHRPAHGRLAAPGVFDYENSELFDQPGKPYVFYSVRDGRLARLIVAQVISSEGKFGWACEWIDEAVIYDSSAKAGESESTDLDMYSSIGRVIPLVLDPNDEDLLDGVVEARDEESSHDVINETNETNETKGEQSGKSGTSSA